VRDMSDVRDIVRVPPRDGGRRAARFTTYAGARASRSAISPSACWRAQRPLRIEVDAALLRPAEVRG
jgi:hypothetical protein